MLCCNSCQAFVINALVTMNAIKRFQNPISTKKFAITKKLHHFNHLMIFKKILCFLKWKIPTFKQCDHTVTVQRKMHPMCFKKRPMKNSLGINRGVRQTNYRTPRKKCTHSYLPFSKSVPNSKQIQDKDVPKTFD